MSLTTRIAIVASSASIALAAGMLTVPASQATSIAPVVGWIHQAYPLPAGGGTIFAADSRGIAADASGNTYVTGSFSGQVTVRVKAVNSAGSGPVSTVKSTAR